MAENGLKDGGCRIEESVRSSVCVTQFAESCIFASYPSNKSLSLEVCFCKVQYCTVLIVIADNVDHMAILYQNTNCGVS